MISNYSTMKDVMAYFTPEQIGRIESSCTNERDKLLLRLLYVSGRRVTEVVGRDKYRHTYKDTKRKITFIKDYPYIPGLRPKDIDYDNEMIRFNILKKKKPFSKLKVIEPEVLERLRYYIESENIGLEERIFPISRVRVFQIIRKAAEDAEIYSIGEHGKGAHPHHLRHSFAVHYIKNSDNASDLRLLQDYLEHSNINVTSHYLQFNQEEQRKKIKKMFQK